MIELEYIYLDREVIGAFQDMFPGDISEYASGRNIAVGAMYEGEKAGLFLGYPEDREFNLIWFYIVPKFRRRGVGSKFMQDMIEGISRTIDIDIINTLCVGEETKDFFSYMRYGFSDDVVVYQYDSRLADMTEVFKADIPGVVDFSKITEREKKQIEEYFENDPEQAFPVKNIYAKNAFLPQSRVLLENGQVKALVLIQEEGDSLVLPFVYSNGAAGKKLISILAEIKEELVKAYGEDKNLRVTAINESSQNLAKKMLPEATVTKMYLANIAVGY